MNNNRKGFGYTREYVPWHMTYMCILQLKHQKIQTGCEGGSSLAAPEVHTLQIFPLQYST